MARSAASRARKRGPVGASSKAIDHRDPARPAVPQNTGMTSMRRAADCCGERFSSHETVPSSSISPPRAGKADFGRVTEFRVPIAQFEHRRHRTIASFVRSGRFAGVRPASASVRSAKSPSISQRQQAEPGPASDWSHKYRDYIASPRNRLIWISIPWLTISPPHRPARSGCGPAACPPARAPDNTRSPSGW